MNYNKEIKSIGIRKMKLAERLGISHVTLSYYLNGVRPFPLIIEDKLKELLKSYKEV